LIFELSLPKPGVFGFFTKYLPVVAHALSSGSSVIFVIDFKNRKWTKETTKLSKARRVNLFKSVAGVRVAVSHVLR
jgi:hypothetical protein